MKPSQKPSRRLERDNRHDTSERCAAIMTPSGQWVERHGRIHTAPSWMETTRNGPHRLDNSMPFSRVIEVEVATKKMVWEYREKREIDFFSPRISNAQRLPNGNTIICEGDFARLFEVTSDGELVWEYVNPYFAGPPNAQNNRVFRAYRYSAEQIATSRATVSAV